MPTIVDTTGLDRLRARFEKLVSPNATPLMMTWMKIMEEDNRKGVLAGLDKDGNPMRAVTYRPITLRQKLTDAQRNNVVAKKRRGIYAGHGAHPAGTNNSLTSSEYRKLDGPPLAQRRQFSRVITNYVQRFGQTSAKVWEAVGYWNEVVSRKGVKFLHWHFDGTSRLPKRDLRGVRPEAKEKARKAARAWMIDQIRSNS